jgi:hypothetical protein
MMSDRHPPHPPRDDSATVILKRTAPAWYWLRKNFSFPAVVTILATLATCAGYIISLRTKVIVLDREITRYVDVVPAQVGDHERRITVLETEWRDAREAAGTPPTPRRK